MLQGRISVSVTVGGHRRDWFRAVKESGKAHVTALDRFSATNDFCFTLSVPVLDAQQRLVRVLGADVRLSSML